jgi:hypothetical protein
MDLNPQRVAPASRRHDSGNEAWFSVNAGVRKSRVATTIFFLQSGQFPEKTAEIFYRESEKLLKPIRGLSMYA